MALIFITLTKEIKNDKFSAGQDILNLIKNRILFCGFHFHLNDRAAATNGVRAGRAANCLEFAGARDHAVFDQ